MNLPSTAGPTKPTDARGLLRHGRALASAVREALRDAVAWTATRLPGSGSRRTGDRRHVLLVDDLLPDPLFGAGYPRAFEIVHSLLRTGYRVSVYPMASAPADLARMRELFGDRDGLAFHSGSGARGLRRWLMRYGETVDVLLVSRPSPMQAWTDLQWRPRHASMPSVIYDAEALLAPRERRRRKLYGPAWSDAEYDAALADELRLIAAADAITAVGPEDAAAIGAACDVPVFILPHAITVGAPSRPFAERQDLLFVGRLTGEAERSPNVDSVRWFVAAVMPELDRLIGTDYRLHVVGRVGPESGLRGSDRVVLHGIVENIDPMYAASRLFVAPTRFAAGVPLKVMEAMGKGIPCVATPLLAEQLGTTTDELPTGGSPAAFAQACALLYNDADEWNRVRDAASRYITRTCAPATFDTVVDDVMRQVLTGSTVNR